MSRPLKVLIAEDSAGDAELIVRELRKAGFDPDWRRVETEPDFVAALSPDLDIILSDFEMPQFSGIRALEVLREHALEVPFILISGTIGEEIAVAAMKSGATDYLLKDRLARLGPAIGHALEQGRLRRERIDAGTKFRTVFEAANDGIVILLEGVFIDVNRKGLSMVGMTRDQFLGCSADQIAPPYLPDGRETKELAAQKIHAALAGEPQFFEWVIRRPDDTRIDVEVSLNRFDLGGKKHLQAIVRDITERKQAQDILAESERRFREMLKNVELIAVTLDRHGSITFCNDYLLRTTGWRRVEVLGGDWFAIFVPDDPELKRIFLEGVEDGEIPTYYESPIRTKSREHRDVVWNNTVLRDAAGRIIGTASLGEDVTVRKQALMRVREQAEMLDLAHEAIIVRDIETRRISFWNHGAERLYGWTASEAEGRDIGELIFVDPSAPDTVNALLLEAGEWRGELQHVSKDGKKLTVSGNSTLMRDGNGNPKSVLAINIDITERKILEAQVLRAQRMESIGTLASGVAHDLNNILSPILMSVPILRREISPEKRDAIITTIEMSATRGAQIVKQVLTFGRGLEGEKRALHVGALMKEWIKIMEETFPKNIVIDNFIAASLWPVVGDGTRLHQVLLNLCVNARDAMPDGGILRLNAINLDVDASYASMLPAATAGPHVLLEVSDNGTGIEPEIVERIFDPFFTTKGLGQGTGLGLSTVHGIIKSHGGVIKVDTDAGKGTTFQVYLPAQPKRDAEDAPAASPEIPEGHGELILIVDDEASIRVAARTALEAFGYEVVLAADGTEALAVYAMNSHRIALVLTDLMMPLMDGMNLLHALRRMAPELPFIASTGLGEKAKEDELKAMKIACVLHKPYGAATLLRTIHEALKSLPTPPTPAVTVPTP